MRESEKPKTNDLEVFKQVIEKRLAAKRREWTSDPVETENIMKGLDGRLFRFTATARRLIANVIHPRLEVLAGLFPNSKLARPERDDRCRCWFGYCERFPATVKVEFAIEHDEHFENATVHFELYIVPVFFKYDEHDKFTVPTETWNEATVAEWVEDTLLEFLDIYMRLDRGHEEFNDEIVIDPVCGMKIWRHDAVIQATYHGHTYYFCHEKCRQTFLTDPAFYVQVITS